METLRHLRPPKQEYVLGREIENGEPVPSLSQQVENVKSGVCLYEWRDAIQGIPNVIYPDALTSFKALQKAEQLGIDHVTVGIYTKCDTVIYNTTAELLELLRDNSKITPSIAIPAMPAAAEWATDLYTNVHRGLEIYVFMPVAEERREIHGWSIEQVVGKSEETIMAITDTLPANVISVIEQASQATEKDLFQMVEMSARAKAAGVCIADSLSCFTEEQAFNCVNRVRNFINRREQEERRKNNSALADQFKRLRIEFHGHNDFGDASRAALGAMRAGARVHVTPGTPAGIGERAGNASMNDTLRKMNNFLVANGEEPRRPTSLSNEHLNRLIRNFMMYHSLDYDSMSTSDIQLITNQVIMEYTYQLGTEVDKAFIDATHVDPKKYGPRGDNAFITCAALHADYVRKIWNRLRIAKSKLQRLEDKFMTYDGHHTAELSRIMYLRRQEVRRLASLYATGYLPHRNGQKANGEHRFALNPFSNEDTIRMYYQELTAGKKDPEDLSDQAVKYILWVIKTRNRPLTPLEVFHLLVKDSNSPQERYAWDNSLGESEYPWETVEQSNPDYAASPKWLPDQPKEKHILKAA